LGGPKKKGQKNGGFPPGNPRGHQRGNFAPPKGARFPKGRENLEGKLIRKHERNENRKGKKCSNCRVGNLGNPKGSFVMGKKKVNKLGKGAWKRKPCLTQPEGRNLLKNWGNSKKRALTSPN